jgi:hypothetical protein
MQGKWHPCKSIDPVSKDHSKPIKRGIQYVPFYTSTIGKHPTSSTVGYLKFFKMSLNANINAMKPVKSIKNYILSNKSSAFSFKKVLFS